jgi:hypothetical protein
MIGMMPANYIITLLQNRGYYIQDKIDFNTNTNYQADSASPLSISLREEKMQNILKLRDMKL